MLNKLKNNSFIALLLISMILSCVYWAKAATPNPGHSWATVGDGFFSVTGPSTMRTYSFPDVSTTVLTTNALVTAAQGGSGTSTLTGVLKGNASSAWTALIKPNGLLVGTLANQALSFKTLNLSNNSLNAGIAATTTQLMKNNGTQFAYSATTTPKSFLQTNSAGTDVGWQVLPTGPGGADTQIQYNNQGDWGATSSLTIGSDILGVSNMLVLTNQTVPVAPAAGKMKLYARSVSGRDMIQYLDSNGIYSALQPNLYNNFYVLLRPGSGTTVTTEGDTFAASGVNSTNASQSWGLAIRLTYTSTVRYLTSSVAKYYVGSVDGRNGFFFFARLYTNATSDYSTSWIYTGMIGGLTSTACSNGATNLNRAGFRYYAASDGGNWQINTNDNTTNTTASTGMGFAVAKLYDLYLYMPPRGTTLYWRIDNLTDSTSAEGSTGTTLPVGSTALAATVCADRSNNVSTNLEIATIYTEVPR